MENLQTKELRIGNLVMTNFKRVEEIIDIEPIDFIENYIKLYKPIPLTEEWLLKFGFDEKLTKGWFFNDIFLLEKHIFKNIFYIRFRINEQESIEISKIKYVHQLQNLFFFLTGQELTLNN